MSDPIMVDLRSIVGTPRGAYPIKVQCLCHDDPEGSLAIYEDHAYCYGRKRYFRRYEAAAMLLGLWDGNPATALEAVSKVRPLLGTLKLAELIEKAQKPLKPLDPSIADSFHRYLLSSSETLAFFKAWRGLTEETIDRFRLGYTGSHFTIPVPGASGEGGLYGIRFREDPRVPSGGSKYSGISGRNARRLYSMRCLVDLERAGECWVFEGEFDSQIGWQLGVPAVTITNGAGSLAGLPEMVKAAGLNPRRWVLATDQDEAGEQAAWELQQQLGSLAVRARWDSRYKDVSALCVAGGSKQDIMLDRTT